MGHFMTIQENCIVAMVTPDYRIWARGINTRGFEICTVSIRKVLFAKISPWISRNCKCLTPLSSTRYFKFVLLNLFHTHQIRTASEFLQIHLNSFVSPHFQWILSHYQHLRPDLQTYGIYTLRIKARIVGGIVKCRWSHF